MTIQCACPGCARPFKLADNLAGKQGRCPDCNTRFEIPAPKAEIPSSEIPKSEIHSQVAAAEEDAPYQLAAAEEPPPAVRPQPATHEADFPDDEAAGFSKASTFSPPGQPRVVRPPSKSVFVPVRSGESKSPDQVFSRARQPAAPRGKSAKRRLYWLFALTMVPLAFSLGMTDDTEARFERTLENQPEEAMAELEQNLEQAVADSEAHNPAELREMILAALPGHRIEGAHLARDSWLHWLYALLAAAAMFGLVLLAFEGGDAQLSHLLFAGLGTATIGILFLLMVQWIAGFSAMLPLRGPWFWVILVGILKIIGFSYRSAMDPDPNFFLSFFGFTIGVGLCEEFTKAMPMLGWYRNEHPLDWRGACLWGLASGIGFGVAEGIMYSSEYYNGLAGGGIYLVRFISCVGLHATWSGAAGILIYRYRHLLLGEDPSWTDIAMMLALMLGGSIVLHGLYDTLLKMELEWGALFVALISFACLAALIEHAHACE